jgi:hypothetical protein
VTDVVVAADRVVVAERREIRTVRAVTPGVALVDRPRQSAVRVEPAAVPLAVTQFQPVARAIAAGLQGPPGPPGASGGEDVARNALERDWTDENTYYEGEAAPGSAADSPAWSIKRVTINPVDDDKSVKWAGGTAAFDKRWDQRASLAYS